MFIISGVICVTNGEVFHQLHPSNITVFSTGMYMEIINVPYAKITISRAQEKVQQQYLLLVRLRYDPWEVLYLVLLLLLADKLGYELIFVIFFKKPLFYVVSWKK